MLEYTIVARRTGASAGVAECKEAHIALDTAPTGRSDAFNPAELFLASIAACMLKGVERVTPMLHFALRGAEVRVNGVRQDRPPKMLRVRYELVVDTDESDARLDLLHRNVRQYGTIYNTVASAVALDGVVRRASVRVTPPDTVTAVAPT